MIEAFVLNVIDGDTIRVATPFVSVAVVRLIGVDAPEVKRPEECFGKEAADALRALVDGKQVFLEEDPTQGDKDRYDRQLRYVWSGPDLVNEWLVLGGYAEEYTYRKPYAYRQRLIEAERYAKGQGLGKWGNCP